MYVLSFLSMSYLIDFEIFDPIFQDKEQVSKIYLMLMNFSVENYLLKRIHYKRFAQK